MRLVDKKYQNLPSDYSFSEGEVFTLSDDAWCRYSSGIIHLNEDSITIDISGKIKKVVWKDSAWITQ